MATLASLSSFSYPRSRIAAAAVELNGKLSPTYAQSAVLLYNILMTALKIVLPSSKLMNDGGISQTKEARPKRTLRAYLLVVLVVFCLVDIGEAGWSGSPRHSLIDKAREEAVDTVTVEEVQVTMYTFPHSEVVDDTIGGYGLDSESSRLNWIQKILCSDRMGGISGPLVSIYPPECRFCAMFISIVLIANTNAFVVVQITLLTQLIQSSILFDNIGTSTNKDGGVEISSSNLASLSSRAVIDRDGVLA